MRYLGIFMLLVATTGFMVGCCGSDSCPAPADEGGETQESTNQAPGDQASTATPEAVVRTFLEAARTGNDQQVAALLTPTARREVKRAQLYVAPPASDTARFELGKTQKTGTEVAHVESRWIEQPTPNVEPRVSEMAWALRLTEEGWRIAGMAMFPFKGEPPLLLNYENPEEVKQKHEKLKIEIARRKMAEEQEATFR